MLISLYVRVAFPIPSTNSYLGMDARITTIKLIKLKETDKFLI